MNATAPSRPRPRPRPSPSPRVQAFLDTLGQFESKGRYDVMTGGGRFTDMSQHPNRKNEDGNTAAGKYQFTKGTWDEFSKPLGIEDFSPKSQDRVAVYLLQKAGVIDRLLKGDVAGAVMRAGRRWDALPKNAEGDNILNNGNRQISPILDEYRKRFDSLRK